MIESDCRRENPWEAARWKGPARIGWERDSSRREQSGDETGGTEWKRSATSSTLNKGNMTENCCLTGPQNVYAPVLAGLET